MIYTGCDELRDWLSFEGFSLARRVFGPDNFCNWYAHRRNQIEARECECNEGKKMLLVVTPYSRKHKDAPGGSWDSVEVDVSGESGGVWYKLQAYSLTPDDVRYKLGSIEASLVAAWNALNPKEPE